MSAYNRGVTEGVETRTRIEDLRERVRYHNRRYYVEDAPEVSDVLKYLSVNGHAVLADRIEVDAHAEMVRVPYDGETVGSAPALQETSGAFDAALRAHYGEPGG